MFLLFTSMAFGALVFLVDDAGGLSQSIFELAQLPEKPDLMSWKGVTGEDAAFSSGAHFAFWNVTLALAWGLVYAVSPWQSSRYLVARDEHVVLRAALIAAICVTFLEVVLYLGGAVIDHRMLLAAGHAPTGPEVHQIWSTSQLCAAYLSLGLVQGRQRVGGHGFAEQRRGQFGFLIGPLQAHGQQGCQQ